MSPTRLYHLWGMKLLMKCELLQPWCHWCLLLLKFEMNVSSNGASNISEEDQINNEITDV